MSNEYKIELTFGKGAKLDDSVKTATTVATYTNPTNITVTSGAAIGGNVTTWLAVKLDNGNYHISKATITANAVVLVTPLPSAPSVGKAVHQVPNFGNFSTDIAKDDSIVALIKAPFANAEKKVNINTIDATTVYLEDNAGNKLEQQLKLNKQTMMQ